MEVPQDYVLKLLLVVFTSGFLYMLTKIDLPRIPQWLSDTWVRIISMECLIYHWLIIALSYHNGDAQIIENSTWAYPFAVFWTCVSICVIEAIFPIIKNLGKWKNRFITVLKTLLPLYVNFAVGNIFGVAIPYTMLCTSVFRKDRSLTDSQKCVAIVGVLLATLPPLLGNIGVVSDHEGFLTFFCLQLVVVFFVGLVCWCCLGGDEAATSGQTTNAEEDPNTAEGIPLVILEEGVLPVHLGNNKDDISIVIKD